MIIDLTPDGPLTSVSKGAWFQTPARGAFTAQVVGGVATATIEGTNLPDEATDGHQLDTPAALGGADKYFESSSPYQFIRLAVTAYTSGEVRAWAHVPAGN